VQDTLTNIQSVTGTGGRDFIVAGAAGGGSITGGAGADALLAGAGVDTFVQAAAASIIATGATVTGGGVVTNNTITFGNSLDVITGFNAAVDKLDLVVATAITGNGVAAAATLAAQNYLISGAYNQANGVFTVNTTTGADTLVVKVAIDADAFGAVANQTDSIVLIGVSSIGTANIAALDTAII
jgi:Ca2+-binding RTX toxin-like protein